MSRRALVSGFVMLVTLVGVMPRAEAQTQVNRLVFIGVSGTGGAPFAEAMLQELSDAYTVISADTYYKTAQQLGRISTKADDVRAVCGELRADAVLAGAVRSDASGRELQMSLRDGVTGSVVARLRFPLQGTTLPQIRDKVVFDVVRALTKMAQPNLAEDEKPLKTTTTPEPEEPNEPIVMKPAKRGASVDRTWRGIAASIGPALTSRSLRFDNIAAPGYYGGTVAGLAVSVTVFPVALSAELANAHPVLASFGIEAQYEHVFAFHSSNGINQLDGSASRWYVRFLGRIPLGHNARGGALTLSTGYQQLTWKSSSPRDLGVPNVDYHMVDLGLGWDHTLGTRYVALGLRVGGLVMRSGGALTSADEYGTAHGGGLDATAALRVMPTRWLTLRLTARYTGLFLAFDATGARYARSAKDQWMAGLLEVGFAL